MSQLESELRSTTGTMENLTHSLNQLNARLDKLVSDVDFRLSTLESQARAGGPPAAGAVPGQTAVSPPPARVGSVAPSGRANPLDSGTASPLRGAPPRSLGSISQRDAVAGQSGKSFTSAASAPRQAAKTRPVAGQKVASASPILPEGTPRDQYNYAFSLLRKADYNNAGAAFQEFVKKNPDDPLVSNARYWLGETYYVQTQFR